MTVQAIRWLKLSYFNFRRRSYVSFVAPISLGKHYLSLQRPFSSETRWVKRDNTRFGKEPAVKHTITSSDVSCSRLQVLKYTVKAISTRQSSGPRKQQQKRKAHLEEVGQIVAKMDSLEQGIEGTFHENFNANQTVSNKYDSSPSGIPGLGRLGSYDNQASRPSDFTPPSTSIGSGQQQWNLSASLNFHQPNFLSFSDGFNDSQQLQPSRALESKPQVTETSNLGRPWNSINTFRIQLPAVPGPTVPIFGQQWNPINTYGSPNQTTKISSTRSVGQQWNSSNGQDLLQPTPSFNPGAYSLDQQWVASPTAANPTTTHHQFTSGFHTSLPSRPVSMSTDPNIGNQLQSSAAHAPSQTAANLMPSDDRHMWSKLISIARANASPERHFSTNNSRLLPGRQVDRYDVKDIPQDSVTSSFRINEEQLAQFYIPPPPGTQLPFQKRLMHRDQTVPPSKESGGVPEPSARYLSRCGLPDIVTKSPRHILLVLDLNGTILHRPDRNKPTQFIKRPDTQHFLDYILANFSIMIWSSAKRQNVDRMCQKLFSGPSQQKLIAIWSRDEMRLSKSDYEKRVQVYKRLTFVWTDSVVQRNHPEAAWRKTWDQGNTVLLDDSTEKARSEPHNLVRVPEFNGASENPNILRDLANYLTTLKTQGDVSSYMRQNPFKVSPW